MVSHNEMSWLPVPRVSVESCVLTRCPVRSDLALKNHVKMAKVEGGGFKTCLRSLIYQSGTPRSTHDVCVHPSGLGLSPPRRSSVKELDFVLDAEDQRSSATIQRCRPEQSNVAASLIPPVFMSGS